MICLFIGFWGQGIHFWTQKWASIIVLYCTVLYCTLKHSLYQYLAGYRHVICHSVGFWGQGIHFQTQNHHFVYVLYCTVLHCTVKYCLLCTLHHMSMIYVYSQVYRDNKFISELKITIFCMCCTLVYCTLLYCTVL